MDPHLLLLTTTTAATGGGSWLPDWGVVDLPMIVALPVLLVLSGFFSGSETALFSLNEAQRHAFRRGNTLADRAVDALLSDERMLLITILLGNMTVNVLYFVISSVLMMRSATGALVQAITAMLFLLVIVLLGEVGPKMIASAARVRFAALTAPLLLTLHRLIGPLRAVLAAGVVAPLSRLTAPAAAPPDLSDAELNALLDISGSEGVIDTREERLLRDVLTMRRLRVGDVMTPRVRMVSLDARATRADVLAATRAERLTKIPICGKSLDQVIGLLHVKRYLLAPTPTAVTDRRVMSPPAFVPDVASLDQLLEFFRRRGTQSAIVVDEYGGTEGIVSVEDLVEELVGDIVGPDEDPVDPPRLVAMGRWIVSGDEPVHDFAEAFSLDCSEVKAATVGGLIAERVGRVPRANDEVALDHWRLRVLEVEKARVVNAEMVLGDEPDDGDAETAS
ncbi:MAG: HlyC/CorC family transporter [Planctomycetes bacterium]|nr:HlyC/CorC family transporter [Planctomycetota bacterium]